MKEVKLKIPDELLFFWESDEMFAKRLFFLGIVDLLRQGKISKGKAAEFLGIHTFEMLDVMNSAGIPAVNYDEDELDRELDIWKKMNRGS